MDVRGAGELRQLLGRVLGLDAKRGKDGGRELGIGVGDIPGLVDVVEDTLYLR